MTLKQTMDADQETPPLVVDRDRLKVGGGGWVILHSLVVTLVLDWQPC